MAFVKFNQLATFHKKLVVASFEKWLCKSARAHLTWLHGRFLRKEGENCPFLGFGPSTRLKCFPSQLCSYAVDARDAMCVFPLSNVNLNRVQHLREQLRLSQSAVSSSQGLVWCRLECRWQNAPRKLPFASGHLINHDYHTIIIQSHTNRTCRVPSVVRVCMCVRVQNIFDEERCLNINPVYHFKLHFTTALSIPLNWNGWIASSERSH